MKSQVLVTLVVLFFFEKILAQNPPISIIPKPNLVENRLGTFKINPQTRIYFPEKPTEIGWDIAAQALQILLTKPLGQPPTAQPMRVLEGGEVSTDRPNAIFLVENKKLVPNSEAYILDVFPDKIIITASTATGAFYGIQTLRQLLPPEIENAESRTDKSCEAVACHIEDAPRFSYRGLHLDVCRHFFGVDFIKKYIDLLALHKMNTFHWHLTDDQGWRIEVKQFPRLQEVSASRKETLIGHYSENPQKFDGKIYGGFYSQTEIKEVVAYAQKQFVTVLPEIEMPGHAQAALSAYPNLGCTGKPIDVATKWGVFEDVFCAGNDDVFTFFDKIFAEICPLFPGKYIHIGGDECPKEHWKTCEKCQKRLKAEGLKDEHELQSYFIRRVEKMLAARGKSIIGWDEILEGGLAPSATVMSWRGTEGGIAAAKSGHDAIMTPGSHCYFDHYQSNPDAEPLAIGGFLPIKTVYEYEPIPAELTAEEGKHILGTQANLWSEYIPTEEKMLYMAYPRACALAEVAWSQPQNRSFDEFAKRLKTHFLRLDLLGVNYSKALFDLQITTDGGFATIKSADPTVQIRYNFDKYQVASDAPIFEKPIPLSEKSGQILLAAAFLNEKQVGRTTTTQYFFNKATGKNYTMTATPKDFMGNNPHALTDGIRGTAKTWGKWVGLAGENFDPMIDLGEKMQFSSVSTHFLASQHDWIFAPRSIEVLVSDDGLTFKSVGLEEIAAEKYTQSSVETVEIECPNTTARFVKMVVKSFGKIAAPHPAVGENAWLFLDEIEVK
jgi:hexosaminidase